MPTILLPDTPITGDLTPERIADLIDQAAQLIETDGLEHGGFWTDALLRPYEPGDSCCTAGALAVVCGYRSPVTAQDEFVGTDAAYDLETRTYVDDPHPVFATVMTELGFAKAEQLVDWSDKATGTEVVGRLRDAATAIRARGAVA